MVAEAPLTLLAALILGVGGSVHCFAMCGPLACAAQQGKGGSAWRRAVLYHGARVLAYATVGAIVGALGAVTGRLLGAPVERALPWLLALALVAAALDPGGRRLRRLPVPPALDRGLRAIAQLRARLSPDAQALLLGAITPLLPCGLLYGVGLSAAATGGALSGAWLMGGFAFGAVPALFLAQLSVSWSMRQHPLVQALLLRAVPLSAALVLVLRAVQSSQHSCH